MGLTDNRIKFPGAVTEYKTLLKHHSLESLFKSVTSWQKYSNRTGKNIKFYMKLNERT